MQIKKEPNIFPSIFVESYPSVFRLPPSLQSPNTNTLLKNVCADHWEATFHDDPMFGFSLVLKTSERVFPASDLVYLSPDASEPLLALDSTKAYVIGGLVDRTINKVNFEFPSNCRIEVPSEPRNWACRHTDFPSESSIPIVGIPVCCMCRV